MSAARKLTDEELESLSLTEAYPLLGFKNKNGLREKARLGLIPGAFKPGREWRFHKLTLEKYMREKYLDYQNGGAHGWQSVKRKIVPTIIQDFRSVESECKKAREQIREEKRKSMRKNGERKSVNTSFSAKSPSEHG